MGDVLDDLEETDDDDDDSGDARGGKKQIGHEEHIQRGVLVSSTVSRPDC